VLLTTIWGTRLSGYLARRNLGKGEDYRYVKMREKHGSRFPIVSLLTVFGLQGLIMLIVSLPLQTGMTVEAPTTLGLLACIGCAVWLIGFAFEAGGDWQLARFKADESNRGKVLDSGFWRYTRHPNYFGDFMIWWGVFLISFGTGAAWWSAIGPAVMSFFLIKVSGVAMLEKTLKKKPGYADYIAKTNAFFPWFPAR
jgi:steroid 5-alpha reductase family enzyme